MIDSAAGETIAAPRPWTARAAISHASDWARPPASEASENSDEPDHEHPPAPHQVGEAAAEQQEAAEGERVGVDDPREVVLGEVQGAADRGQRDVDDRGVDHDDELRHREQREREVLGAWCHGR